MGFISTLLLIVQMRLFDVCNGLKEYITYCVPWVCPECT